ncbi:MAG: hypothetical protein J2P45_32050 [Candidatus Dormibacteraeota bacterium]|nr:hypothetical protein [Candidatus Dormibacteraeota bacterium]
MARRAVVPEELKRAPFTLDEARRAGLTKRQVQGPSWRRIGWGLYAWAGLGDSPHLVLAAMRRRLPPGSVFSGCTAAYLHGLDLPPCDPMEATIPTPCSVSARAGVCLRRADLGHDEVVTRHGLPVTSAVRTVADLGGRERAGRPRSPATARRRRRGGRR